jgi:DNA-binding GntR family transcriptional regulator
MAINHDAHTKVSDKVLEILEDDILSGKFRPGERLVEREMAARLGVSRVPVREALITLERWGLVKKKRANDKWREIVALNKQDIAECYHIKCFIESQAFLEKSLEKDDVLLKSLNKIINEMDEFLHKEDVKLYRDANLKFHHEIVLSLKNNRLYNIYLDISRILRWFQNVTLYVPRMRQSNKEHRQMIKAYKKQDLLEIRRIFKIHHDQAVETLAKKIEAE